MAQAGFTKVEFASLEAGEAAFKQAYANLTTTISDLQNQLNANLAEWIGTAQSAYHTAETQWRAAQTNMNEIISSLGQVTGVANANFQQTEQTNTLMWS